MWRSLSPDSYTTIPSGIDTNCRCGMSPSKSSCSSSARIRFLCGQGSLHTCGYLDGPGRQAHQERWAPLDFLMRHATACMRAWTHVLACRAYHPYCVADLVMRTARATRSPKKLSTVLRRIAIFSLLEVAVRRFRNHRNRPAAGLAHKSSKKPLAFADNAGAWIVSSTNARTRRNRASHLRIDRGQLHSGT